MILLDTIKNLSRRVLKNREFQIVFGMSALNAIGGLVANRVLTKYVPANELADVFLIAVSAVWLTLPAGGMYLVNLHQWPVAKATGQIIKYSKFVDKAVFYHIILVVLASSVVFHNSWFSIDSLPLFISFMLLAAGQGLFQITSSISLAERRRATSGLLDLSFGNTGRYFFIITGVLLLGKNNSVTVIQLQAAHSIIIAIISVLIYRHIRKVALKNVDHGAQGNPTELSMKATLNYFIPTMLSVLITQLVANAERWSLNWSFSKDSISYFVLAVGLATAASNSLNTVVVHYFYPQLTNEYAKHQNSALFKIIAKKFFASSLVLQLPIFILFMVFPGFLTSLFFDPTYRAIAEILPVVFIGTFFLALSSSVTNILYSLQKTVSLRIGHTLIGLTYAGSLATLAYLSKLDLSIATKLYAVYQFLIFIFSALHWVKTEKSAPVLTKS